MANPFSARNATSREHKRNTPPTTPLKTQNPIFPRLFRPQTEHKKHYRTLFEGGFGEEGVWGDRFLVRSGSEALPRNQTA
jgi:hypothetical protein